jgi:hypothetical protein
VAEFPGHYFLPFLVHGKTRTSVLTIWAIITTRLFQYAFAIWLNNDLEINRSVWYERSKVEPSLDSVGQPCACGKDAGLWGIQNLAIEPCVDELNIIILINNDPDVFGLGVSPVQVKHSLMVFRATGDCRIRDRSTKAKSTNNMASLGLTFVSLHWCYLPLEFLILCLLNPSDVPRQLYHKRRVQFHCYSTYSQLKLCQHAWQVTPSP